jgi:NADPH:quinone reductase-like Zn-dependent oxidoreductase
MKAAIIYQKGEMPQYVDVPDPIVQNENELLLTVKASAIKNFDKSVAKGTHYSSNTNQTNARVIGSDGVGLLADGTRVYALGVSGMVAEKAVIEKDKMMILPDGIDDATGAALPNAIAGAAMALRFRAGIQTGDTVLINGATGFTGQLAVQIAKYYGAQKVIATGRNPESLKKLLTMGADEVISVNQDDEKLVSEVKEIHHNTPLDVIVDYLWGHSAELLLSALKGNGSFTHRTRFVSVGSMTGDKIQLSAENLRSVNLQLTGSGLGSWTKNDVQKLFSEILPEMLQLTADGKLKAETAKVNLKDIERLWEIDVPNGQRLVIVM